MMMMTIMIIFLLKSALSSLSFSSSQPSFDFDDFFYFVHDDIFCDNFCGFCILDQRCTSRQDCNVLMNYIHSPHFKITFQDYIYFIKRLQCIDELHSPNFMILSKDYILRLHLTH